MNMRVMKESLLMRLRKKRQNRNEIEHATYGHNMILMIFRYSWKKMSLEEQVGNFDLSFD